MSSSTEQPVLAALAAKASTWRNLPLHEKADLLQAMLVRIQAMTVEAHVQCSRESARTQCINPDRDGGLTVVLEALVWIGVVKGHLERLRDTLRGLANPAVGTLKNIAMRQRTTRAGEAGGGPQGQIQSIASVFPLNKVKT